MNNKDLIRQYVDTGLTLTERQVAKLPDWSKKTYFRKRLIAQEQRLDMTYYELKQAPPEVADTVINKIGQLITNNRDDYEYLDSILVPYISDLFIRDNDYSADDQLTRLFLSNTNFTKDIPLDILELFILRTNEPEMIPQMVGEAWQRLLKLMDTYNMRRLLIKSFNPIAMFKILGNRGQELFNGQPDGLHPTNLLIAVNPVDLLTILGDAGVEWVRNQNYNARYHYFKNYNLTNEEAIKQIFAKYPSKGDNDN